MRTNDYDGPTRGIALGLAALGAVAVVDAVLRRARQPHAAPIIVSIIPGTDGKLTVDHPDVTMTAPGLIEFEISRSLPAIFFKDKGTIIFDTGGASFGPPIKEVGKDDKIVKVFNKHTELGSFKYTLYLDGPGNPVIDPKVHNGSGLGPDPVQPSEPIIDKILDLLFGRR